MVHLLVIICTGVLLSPLPDQEGNKLGSIQGRARFQQRRDASYQVFFPLARQGAERNSRHSDRNISLFLPGRDKDLPAPLYYTIHFNNIDTRAVIKFFPYKARRRKKFTPF